jgi:membrane protein DedA with SNARE-associated domain
MEDSFWSFLDRLAADPGPLAYLVMGISAGLEYVFPPFPGDTIILFAGFLIGAKGWGFGGVFLVLNAGSLAGASIDYAFGRWIARGGHRWRERGPRWERLFGAIDRISKGFARHPILYLSINRFLPSMRAIMFVAAGTAAVPFWKVAVFGLLSSCLWTALILVVGRFVGYEKDRLIGFLQSYSVTVWALLAIALIAFLVVSRRRRRS